MTNSAAPGFLRSRAARDLLIVLLSGLAVAGLMLLSTATASAADLNLACAMCDEDTASDPGTHVLVTLPADGSVPAIVPCLVDMGYVAGPVPGQPGVVGLDVLHGDVELCTAELNAVPAVV